MSIVVVATDEEYKLAKRRFKHKLIIKTGVGGLNVIEKLRHIPKWIKIINFGFVGSNIIPKNTEVKIGCCITYHPHVEYNEPVFELEGDIPCYTSNDFILETKMEEPCVFDMELAYILALGFKRVESIKIVSDNLSLEEYNNIKEGEENE